MVEGFAKECNLCGQGRLRVKESDTDKVVLLVCLTCDAPSRAVEQ